MPGTVSERSRESRNAALISTFRRSFPVSETNGLEAAEHRVLRRGRRREAGREDQGEGRAPKAHAAPPF